MPAALFLGLLLAASRAQAANLVLITGVSLSDTSPCPGDVITLTVTLQNPSAGAVQANVLAAVELASTHAGCPQSFVTNAEADKWWVVYNGSTPGTASPAISSDCNSAQPGAVLNLLAGQTLVQTFKIQVPGGLSSGTIYHVHVGENDYFASCNQIATAMCADFTTCLPSSTNSGLLKRVEGTAANGEIMLYWLDYDFFNSTNNQVRDTVPACMNIVAAEPQPFSGAAATIIGNQVSWRVEDAVAGSTVPYKASGSLWVEVTLSGCAGSVVNQGQFSSSSSGGLWSSSNSVTQTVGGVNILLAKQQFDGDLTSNPLASPLGNGAVVADGTTVSYVLQYTLSGSVLDCFDSFNPYAVGTYTDGSLGPLAPRWSAGLGGTGTNQWQIVDPGNGDRYLRHLNSPAGYHTLRYDCPAAEPDGSNFCSSGDEVEADVMHNQAGDANADVGIFIRENGLSGAAFQGYMILLSGDPNPQGADGTFGHLIIQKNTGGAATFPSTNAECPNNTGAGCTGSALDGIWYTIKAVELAPGHILAKYWKRGAPEPAGWMINWTDPGTPISCAAPGGGGSWKPSIAGQNSVSRFDNFRVYSTVALSAAHVWDTVPNGVDFSKDAPLSNGSTPPVGGHGLIRWDFTGSSFGAIGGILYEGSGSFTWVGVANCLESPVVNNTGKIDGTSGVYYSQSSNTTTFDIMCGTPTATPTRTASPSVTATRSDTPTLTSTLTPSPTRTSTPTPSETPSRTPTNSPSPTPTATLTRTATPTVTDSDTVTSSPTQSSTKTATPTPSPTSSATATRTPSPTVTSTLTATDTITVGPSPTFTATRSSTPTFTPTSSITMSSTMTSTRSSTPTSTPSSSITMSSTVTATRTATPTATATFTDSSTITPGPSPTFTSTASDSPSQTLTFTDTLTRTPTSTLTATATPTPTFTDTPSFTDTPASTMTDTPTFTPTATQTPSYTSSSTQSATSTDTRTRTDTPTATPSRTVTSTKTASPTRTVSPTITQTFTFTQTPIAMPFHAVIAAYNSAGERVKLIFEGASQIQLDGGKLSAGNLVEGGLAMQLTFSGQLGGAGFGVSWDGQNDSGQMVGGGFYYIKVEFSDPFGKTTSYISQVAVVDARPFQSLVIYNSAGEAVRHVALPGGTVYSELSLADQAFALDEDPATGLPSQQYKLGLRDNAGNSSVLPWDGLNDQGVPVKPGSYSVVLISKQGLSDSKVMTRSFVVLDGGGYDPFKHSVLAPNPVKASDGSLWVNYRPCPLGTRRIQAQLFNLAGESVALGLAEAGSGLFELKLPYLASGTYILRISMQEGPAVLKIKFIKVAILR